MTNLSKTLTNHLGKLLKLAHADGEFHENEKSFIAKIGKENGLSDTEVNALLFHPPVYDDVIPFSLEDRLNQLIDYVRLMSADGFVTEDEVIVYYSLAQDIGFDKVILDLLLVCVEKGLEKGLSYNEIQEECAIFLD